MESKSLSRSHRQLIAELKQLRERKKLAGAALGDALGWSQSKVSKIENGRTKPSTEDVEAWGAACGADADTIADLVSLAEAVSNEVRPWSAKHGTLAERNREIAQTEAETTTLKNFQPAVVPGLLQTADYARRVITLLDTAGKKDVAEAVAVRMERQTALYDESHHYEFILTEGALRWRPGPPALMLAQLDRLVSIATLPNVILGVLPFEREATSLYLHGFTVFEVPESPWVLVEMLTEERRLNKEGDVAVYREAFERLRDAALVGDEAAVFLRRLMTEVAAS